MKPRASALGRLLLPTALIMFSGSAQAASQTWKGTTATDANWTTAGNWSGGAVPGASNPTASTLSADLATFNTAITTFGGAANPILNDANRQVRSILFDTANAGAYVIGTLGGNILQLGHSGNVTVGTAVTAAQTINAPISLRLPSSTAGTYSFINNSTSTGTLNIAGSITSTAASTRGFTITLNGTNTGDNLISGQILRGAGSMAVVKQGAGTWILSGDNGGGLGMNVATIISAGTLAAQHANALSTTVATTINGGTLRIDNGITLATTSIALNNTGAISAYNGTGVYNNVITVAASSGVTLSAVGSSDVLSLGNGVANKFTGGAGSVTTIAGDGTVFLTGSNNYEGTFGINSGILKVGNATALGSAATAGVSFGAGSTGKLTLNGTNVAVATLNSNATVGTPIVENNLAGTATLTVSNTSGISSYGGVLQNGAAGTLALTKDGASTLILSGTNTYSGGTTVTNGTLTASSSSALGSGAVGIGSGGTLSTGNLTIGDLTLTGSGNIVLAGAANSITSTGAVAISGASNLLTVGGSTTPGTTYTLLSGTSLSASGMSLTGSAVGGATVALGTTSTVGRTDYAFSSTATALQLAVTGGAFNLTWNGGNANWNTVDANWQKDGVGSNIVFFTGDNIAINQGDSIAVDGGGVAIGTLAVTNTSGTAALSGGALNGITLAKSGAGSLLIGNATTLSGGATITDGTVTLDAANTLTAASVVVSGGTLDIAGNNQSLANVSLTSGSITGTSGVLTGTGSAFDVRAGSISAILGGGIGLNKTTGGTVALSGANSYTGATLVSAGTLVESSTGLIADSSALTVDGASAVFDLGANHDDTVAAVSLKNGGGITGSGTSALTGSSYAVESGSVSAILAGSGTLTKTTAGVVTLSGANTYNGGTNVKNGTLNLDGGTNRLLNTSSLVLGDTGTSGKLVLGGTTVADQALTGLTTTGSGGSVVGGNASNSTLALDIGGTNTFGGTLGGAGTNENNLALTKSGVGTLTLSVANTYTGGTQLNGGTLALGHYQAAGTGTITAVNGTTIAALSGVGTNAVGNAITVSGTNANVTLTNNNASGGINSAITGSAGQTVTISNAGGTVVNMNSGGKQFQNFLGTVSIASAQSLAFRSTSLNNGGDNTLFDVNGSLSTRNGGNVALGALSGSGTVSMGGSGNNNVWLTYTIGARSTNANFSGVIQDADTANGKRVAIVKTGSATQTLSGDNAYTGTTAVNQGTLVVTGSIDNSAVSVSNAGTVLASGATGTIGQSVTVNTGAILAVGGVNTVGTATVGSGGLDIKSSSIFEWDLTTNSSSSGFDTIATSNNGNLAVASGAIFKVVLGGSVSAADSFWTSGTQTWNVFSVNGTGTTTEAISGHLFDAIQVVDATTGSLFTGANGNFSFTGSTLTWSAVPEPTSALAGLLVGAGLLRRRRSLT